MKQRAFNRFFLFVLTMALIPAIALGQPPPDVPLNPEKALSQYVHDVWHIADGLPQNAVHAIAQTPDGYLWLGTQDGLVRFDGRTFEPYTQQYVEALQSNDIRALTQDRGGTLWIGTRDAGLVKYRDSEFIRVAGLEHHHITTIVESWKGHLWVGTASSGLRKIEDGVLEEVRGFEETAITALYEDVAGNLWIGTERGDLFKWEEGMLMEYDRQHGLPGGAITAITGNRTGTVWIGTRLNGLYQFANDQFSQERAASRAVKNRIRTLFSDRAGTLWIGTEQQGFVRYHPREPAERSESFTTREGLSFDVVNAFFQDREGNLWIGTDGGGLNRLKESKFTSYGVREGLAGDYAQAIYEDDAGGMWIGSKRGVSYLHNDHIRTFTIRDGLAADFVLSIAGTPDGSIWLGTFGGGLTRYKNGRFNRYDRSDGLPDHRIFALHTDSTGALWIGTGNGLSVYRDNRISVIEGLSSQYVTSLLEDRAGSMWVGTYDGGLSRITDGEVISFTMAEGLTSNAILALHEDEEGVLWVGTHGGGLNRVENGVITKFTVRNGLLSDTIFQILEDDAGNLWMSCNRGLLRVSKEQFASVADSSFGRIKPIVYNELDGLRSAAFNGGFQPAGWKRANGELWFPTTAGVVTIDPQNITLNPNPPLIVINEVRVDGEPVSMEEAQVVKAGSERFEFDYTGLSLFAPEGVQYEIKLEGSGGGWVKAGTRTTAYYTNLAPGAYEFKVRAQSRDGVKTAEIASYTFELAPFFYQTMWFRLLVLLVVIIAAIGMHFRRIAQLRKHEHELEKAVQARTYDMMAERDKTERANKVLERRTARLLEALEKNQEILGVTAHDLKNPLAGIIGLLDILLEDVALLSGHPSKADSMKSLSVLKSESERMLRIVIDLLENHAHGGEVMLNKEVLDLEEIAKTVIQWNQRSADKKKIILHFDSKYNAPVEADSDAMLRVFDNLVSNAIKYSPAGTGVWVELTGERNEMALRVSDNGPGLTEEDKAQVFGKLQRLSAKPTGGEHSTGLGLYIVKQLVEQHGGSVGVRSEHGQGAMFWLRIPMAVSEEVV